MSLKIDQAFISTFIDAAFGLPIAHENMEYQPVNGTAYAELINLPNDITPLSMNDSNVTDGIFRVILRYPVNEGAVSAKTMAETIMSAFTINSKVCYDGLCAVVNKVYRQPGVAESGWYKIVVTIGYIATIAR
jgi:hypothetical protein